MQECRGWGDGNRLSGVSINKAAEQMLYRVDKMSEEEVQREIQELREMVIKQEKRIDRLEKFAIAAYRELLAPMGGGKTKEDIEERS